MNPNIIEESQNWTEVVPDEYAIKCIEQYRCIDDDYDRILRFLFVTPTCQLPSNGFIQKCGIFRIPANTEGIVILSNDYLSMPVIYFRNDGKITYEGILKDGVSTVSTHKAPNFSKIFHHSENATVKQKSDADAPDWLKNFAKKHSGSVAYFEF